MENAKGIFWISSIDATDWRLLNSDGKVGLADLMLLASAYNSKHGDAIWNPMADLAAPFEVIDLTDLVTMAMHYGQQRAPSYSNGNLNSWVHLDFRFVTRDIWAPLDSQHSLDLP